MKYIVISLSQSVQSKSQKASRHPFNQEASIFVSKSFFVAALYISLSLSHIRVPPKIPESCRIQDSESLCPPPYWCLVTCLHPFWRACEHTGGRRTRTAPGRLSEGWRKVKPNSDAGHLSWSQDTGASTDYQCT